MAQTQRRITVCTKIIILIIAILLLFLIPTLLLLFTPIYIFRYFVHLSSKFLKPDLGKIVSSTSACFAYDDLYNKPRATLLTFLFLEGELSVDELRKHFQEKVLESKTPAGELKNPELLQYISTWMGFYFWKWDNVFRIENHIREYDGQVRFDYLNNQALREIMNELVVKPFVKYQSPWELLVFPNYRVDIENEESPGVPKTAFILRIHHAAADGFSIAKLIVTGAAGEAKLDTVQPNYVRKSLCRKILDGLTFIFRFPYDISNTTVRSGDPLDQFHMHLREDQLSRRMNSALSPKIPLSYIKEIRSINKASFAGIIMAAFTGALRTLMLEHSGEVPEYVSLLAPVPVPGHPDKLRNHMSAVVISLPVGLSDPETRLRSIEANLKSLKNSTFPFFVFWFTKAAGSLFPCMTRFLTKQYGPTAIMSSFPGSNNQIGLLGRPIIDCMLTGGLLPGNIGIGMGTLSYNGSIKFTVGIDESILPSSERSMDGFMDNILKELDILRNRQIV